MAITDSANLSPDPSTLTANQMLREVASLKELVWVRLDAMDVAITLARGRLETLPEERSAAINCLRDVMLETFKTVDVRFTVQDEKFSSVQTQFTERDTRGERESRDNKIAVDAAFAAQKDAAKSADEANQKAIDKSEKGTKDTLEKQSDLFKSTTDALAAQIGDLKDRLTRIEGMNLGSRETATTHRQDNSLLIGSVIGLVGIVSGIVMNIVR